MYEAAAKEKGSAKPNPEGPSSGSAPSGGEKSNVVDADYEVVDGDDDEKRKR